ncbi:MAG TPA: sialidase, partial [Rhizobiales bacterium]|nr:sialidase [Hyphomicrobiales bacterium]
MTTGSTRKTITRRKLLLGATAGALATGAIVAGRSRKVQCYLLSGSASTLQSPAIAGRGNIFSNPPFAMCHASTLAFSGQNLVACWFGGSHEGRPDVAIWSAIYTPKCWQPPKRITGAKDESGEPAACWNPVLWQQPGGPLHLFYKAGKTPRTWWAMHMASNDNGHRWSTPERLPQGFLGPVRNKPLLLPDNRLLCPSSTEDNGWQVHFEWTKDGGLTWEKSASLGGRAGMQIIQPALLVHPGGKLQALCRSRSGFIAQSWSHDGGRSWSPPEMTDLVNPNSAIDALTLADGRHLLVHNPSPRCRTPLVVSLSNDG